MTVMFSFMTRLFARAPSLGIIILLSAALWFGEYCRRDLWEPDEARYAYVAREMLQSGAWFAPTLHDAPYPDKPPLLFWLMNLTRHLTDGEFTSFSARLPSFLGSIMSLWAVTQLMARWSTARAAWRAMMILLTTFMFWQEGGWARTDGLLCGCEMMAVYFFFRALESKRNLHWAAGFLFIGLAILAKGPVGLVIPFGILISSSLAIGHGRSLRGHHWLWGIPLALTPGLIWLALAWLSHAPDAYFIEMFTSKSVGRLVESKGHARSILYFLWNFPLDFLPWTFLLPASWVALSGNPLRRRLGAWAAFVIIFFSIPVCKREIYILAAYPGAAMLIAAAWESLVPPKPARLPGIMFFIGLLWVLAIAEAVAMFVPSLPIEPLALLAPMLVMMVGSFVSTWIFRQSGLSNGLFSALVSTLFCHQIAISTSVYPAINHIKAPRAFAQEVDKALPPGQPLYLFQEQLAILPFYANRPGRQIHSVDELKERIASTPYCIVVFMRPTWETLASHIQSPARVHPFGYGSKKAVWVEFGTKPGS